MGLMSESSVSEFGCAAAKGAGDDGTEGVADHVQRQALCILTGGVDVFHKVVQPRHVRVDAVLTLGVFGQVCGAAKSRAGRG